MLLQNICEFGQALQNVFARHLLIIFSLITGYKSIICFDKTIINVSKVKSNMINMVKNAEFRQWPGDTGS